MEQRTQPRQEILTHLKAGQSGTVVNVFGGRGVLDRLTSLGIHRGKKITKISSMYMRGPVVVDLQHSKIALGFHLADKVLVEVDN